MNHPFILIGNPNSKRTTLLQKARARWGLPPAQVISMIDVLQKPDDWSKWFSSPHLTIRLDSPGEDFPVEKKLIEWGLKEVDEEQMVPLPSPTLSEKQLQEITPEPGRILAPGQWYRGYLHFLRLLKKFVDQQGTNVKWMNDPLEIATMFDKRACHALLTEKGISVPRSPFRYVGDWSYEEIKTAMLQNRMPRVFVKVAFGSSASGVMAYQVHPRTGLEVADTTIGYETRNGETIFYNSSKLKRYTSPKEIERLINWIRSQGIHVEEWIPKAKASHGHSFDIRQLVVHGDPCHRVARISSTPITNLHLRNQRATLETMNLSNSAIQTVEELAKKAMSCFPHSFVAGLDLVLSRGQLKPYVLELNPFGDLLYYTEYQGMNTYEWEIKKWTSSFGSLH